MTEREFKIGDIVEFGTNPNALILDISGVGEILGMAYDHPLAKGWIVLITRRDTEFIKNMPEKALVIFESMLKHTK
jgi:hypothetical protein